MPAGAGAAESTTHTINVPFHPVIHVNGVRRAEVAEELRHGLREGLDDFLDTLEEELGRGASNAFG